MPEYITTDPKTIHTRKGLERIRAEKGDINELLESIKQKGQIHPILITRNSDSSLDLVAGERRLLACITGGITIDCVVRESMSDLELRELELEENIQRKDFTWQERTKGIAELHALKQKIYGDGSAGGRAQHADAEGKKAGHSQADTAKLAGVSRARVNQAIGLTKAMEAIPELALAKTENDAVKILNKIEEKILIAELVKRQSENASPATFAEAHFIIGDAFKQIPLIPTGSIDFVNVDTPYAIGLTSVKKFQTGVRTDADYTEWVDDTFIEQCSIVASEMYRALKPDAFMIWWFGIQWYSKLHAALSSVGFEVDKIPGIWFGGSGGAQCNQPELYMARAYDTFFMCRKGSPLLVNRGRINVFSHNKVPAQHKIHPTEKPLPLMEDLFSLFVLPGMKCLSPFLGSGNDLRAFYRLQATGYGFELDQNLKNKFLLRIEEDMKHGATKESKSE